MKIAVVGGAGAMGGIWASALSQFGHEVQILDVNVEAIVAIKQRGLIVEEPDGTTIVTTIPATDRPEEIGLCDLVIIFTKAHHTESAARVILPLVAPTTTILSLQNGWGNLDVLGRHLPIDQLAMGVTYHGARLIGPGVVAHTSSPGITTIGPFANPDLLAETEMIARTMSEAGIRSAATMDIKAEVWKKLLLNAAGLPAAALTGLTSFAMSQRPDLLEICYEIAREGAAVGIALGYQIDTSERVAMVHTILSSGGSGKASMLQDIEAQRKTEIDVINGAIVREGAHVGIPTPLNALMTTLIKAREASWSS